MSSAKSISISGNRFLGNINGLFGIDFIEESLWIKNNNELTNLDGLSTLNQIGGNVVVSGNSSLVNINGLKNLLEVGEDLAIESNSSLTNCCGIQQLLSDPDAIGGSITIENNPSECSSQEEILETDCTVSTNDPIELELTITPNPITSGDQLYIQSSEDILGATIQLRNTNGQLIMTEKLGESYIDLPENVSPGLYFLRIAMDGKASTKKVMVVR